MPPANVKTIGDEIFWRCAKLVSKSRGHIDMRHALGIFKELTSGSGTWPSLLQSWLKEHEDLTKCVYCGSARELSSDYLMPLRCGGHDTQNNLVRACSSCKSSKDGRRLYEWMKLKNKDNISRVAEGRYLLLLYCMHESNGTLDVHKDELKERFCSYCKMNSACIREDSEGKLSIYCLEGIATPS